MRDTTVEQRISTYIVLNLRSYDEGKTNWKDVCFGLYACTLCACISNHFTIQQKETLVISDSSRVWRNFLVMYAKMILFSLIFILQTKPIESSLSNRFLLIVLFNLKCSCCKATHCSCLGSSLE
ncbi:MAG: hypothetical protein ACI90V_012396 [Bacillariaceae sp.]|jgi:hypothetical protein